MSNNRKTRQEKILKETSKKITKLEKELENKDMVIKQKDQSLLELQKKYDSLITDHKMLLKDHEKGEQPLEKVNGTIFTIHSLIMAVGLIIMIFTISPDNNISLNSVKEINSSTKCIWQWLLVGIIAWGAASISSKIIIKEEYERIKQIKTIKLLSCICLCIIIIIECIVFMLLERLGIKFSEHSYLISYVKVFLGLLLGGIVWDVPQWENIKILWHNGKIIAACSLLIAAMVAFILACIFNYTMIGGVMLVITLLALCACIVLGRSPKDKLVEEIK